MSWYFFHIVITHYYALRVIDDFPVYTLSAVLYTTSLLNDDTIKSGLNKQGAKINI